MSERSLRDKEKAKHIPPKNHLGLFAISIHVTSSGYKLSPAQCREMDRINNGWGMRTSGGKTKKGDGKKKKAGKLPQEALKRVA